MCTLRNITPSESHGSSKSIPCAHWHLGIPFSPQGSYTWKPLFWVEGVDDYYRMRSLRDMVALLLCNSDRRERMAMLLVCITFVVVVSGDEHGTFELKHFPFLVTYTCPAVQLAK